MHHFFELHLQRSSVHISILSKSVRWKENLLTVTEIIGPVLSSSE